MEREMARDLLDRNLFGNGDTGEKKLSEHGMINDK